MANTKKDIKKKPSTARKAMTAKRNVHASKAAPKKAAAKKKMAPTKSAATKGPTKKTAAQGKAGRKRAVKKVATKKPATKKVAVKKVAVKKAAVKKVAAKKAPAKKVAVKKAPAKKATVKVPVKTSAAKKAPTKKAEVKKTPVQAAKKEKAPVKKAAVMPPVGKTAHIAEPKAKPAPENRKAAPPAKKPLKQRFQMEFYLNASLASLFGLLSTPSGFSEWFCDDVDVADALYTFKWGDESESAECIGQRYGEYIRFRWIEDVEEDPLAYFEFRIRVDGMTNETCLVVTDHAWPRDVQEERALWEAQIQTLIRVLGA